MEGSCSGLKTGSASFLIKLSLDDNKKVTVTDIVSGGKATPSTSFRKPGDAPAERGWESIDFPLAQPSKVVAVRNNMGTITDIEIQPVT